MRILYDEQHIRTDVYRYQINQGGELRIQPCVSRRDQWVIITFENGKLVSVEHNMEDPDICSRWLVYGGIAAKIAELKKRYS